VADLRSADDLTRDPQAPDEELPIFLDRPPKTNDPKELRRKATDDKAKALKQESDLREVLATAGGIRFLSRLLSEVCYIDESAFNPNNSIMSNIAGRRQIGQAIKEMIRNVDFEAWIRVDREIEAARAKPKRESNSR
jgi:wobble nucleotide-excising tRNase